MVDLSPAWADAQAQKVWLERTPFACFRVDGSAAPGAAFSVHQRNMRRPGFGNSSTQITLAPGNYRLQLLDSLRSDGTSNPTTLTVDVFDAGLEVASFSVQRASANPAEWVRLSDAFVHVEEDLALTGPVELRNGSAHTQRAALVARLWAIPEDFARPDPLAAYLRACGRVRPGKAYDTFGEEERYVDEAGNPHIRPVSTINTSRVPYGFRPLPMLPLPGNYRCQVSGELTNLSSSPATLELDFYDGVAEGGALVHTESVAAGGSATVAVSIDETLELSCGHVEIRNGRTDDLQRANLLIKLWRLG